MRILRILDVHMKYTGFSMKYENNKLYKCYSYLQTAILWILFVPIVSILNNIEPYIKITNIHNIHQFAYIVFNISDLTKAIDGVLFLSCDIMGLFKYICIYRKRVNADKLIEGIRDAVTTGPTALFSQVDAKYISLVRIFKMLIMGSAIPFVSNALVFSYLDHRQATTTFYEETWRFPFTMV